MVTKKHKVEIDENKIEMTTDYDMFRLLKGNRSVDESHVVKLMKKMKQDDLFTPILVNERMEVIDGQHRLEARRRLSYIVPYYVQKNYGLEEVQAINSFQKPWNVADYMESYIQLGKKDYEIYKWFRGRYKLTHTICLSLLMGGRNQDRSMSEIFKSGEFKIKDLEYAKGKAEMLEKIAPHFEGYCDRTFAAAFFDVMEKKVFEFDRFITALSNYPAKMQKMATKEQYVSAIEDLYNYNRKNKVSLRYSE